MFHLKHAVRALLKSRGFTIAAVLMLAVGIGANTAMFSVLRAVLLRPLGFDAPDRVVMLWPRNVQRNQAVGELTLRDREDFQETCRSFEDIAVMGSVNWWGTLRIGREDAFGVPMSVVSATFFEVLGAKPLYGRTFRPEDDRFGAPRVLVLSHGLWVRRFGADPASIGRTLAVRHGRGEESFEIVGVMPPEFFFPRGAEYWTPAGAELAALARADGAEPAMYFQSLGVFHGVGRLKQGITAKAARSDANDALRSILGDHRIDPAGQEVVITPVLDHIFGTARAALKILMGAVAVVLLIVSTNVASLLLARGVARRREIAVRAALGASRGRIVAQVVTESIVLSAAGAVIGVFAAALSLDALVSLSPADIPRLDATQVDAAVLIFTVCIFSVTAIGAGLLPAWTLSSPSLAYVLNGAATDAAVPVTSAKTHQTFVAVQVGATVVLLVAAGLCIRSLNRLNRLDLGYDPANVLTFLVDRLDERYPNPAQRQYAVDDLLARFERVPQVTAAGAVYLRPFEAGSIGMDSGFLLEGQPDTPELWPDNPMLNWQSATPGYFRAMGIRLLRGRNFDERDTRNGPLVVIVSESMAARVWPGENPVGKRLRAFGAEGAANRPAPWQTVVGIVESARYREIQSPRFDIYVPHAQAPSAVKHFVVRTTIEPTRVVAALQSEVTSFDRALSLGGITTMDDIVARTKGPWRFNVLVFSAFGLVALALAAMGLFALLAYAVSQRAREIGVRVALGAAPRDVVRLMVSQGATAAFVGLACGLIAAFLATRLISGLLFEVSTTDPATFTIAAGLLLVVAMLATYFPARRAASIDPVVALRQE
jgi:putative ABC transport system permease protein